MRQADGMGMSYAPPPPWEGRVPRPAAAPPFAVAVATNQSDEARRPPIGPLATAVMLPLSAAIGGAMIVNGRHYAAGFVFKPTIPHFWQTVLDVTLYGVGLLLGFSLAVVVVRIW